MKRMLLMSVLSLCCLFSLAQKGHHFNGVVLAERGNKPVPYASVYWLETGAYMDCDEKGVFEFTIFGDKEAVLVATAVGYTTDTVTVNNTTAYVEFHLGTTSELQGAVITGYGVREHIAKTMNIKTEVITAAALCKMACCSVAESFENSASVSVGYSDAITGARQIRLLGLSGVYTSMLDENRPTMRGLASPFGLSYVPGQWLESIQIAKGPSSVINSTEAITGQINMEHRKPTDEKPLYANLFFSSELAGEANIASSLQLNDRWSTVILGHFSTMPKIHDMNEDGFMDSPLTTHVNFSNRWLYYDPSGIQIRFGVKGLYDDRLGGSTDFKKGDENRSVEDLISSGLWGSRIVNKNFNAYLKAGFPLNWRNTMNIAGVVDYVHHDIGSNFGIKAYDGSQNSLFANIIYQYVPNDSHRINAGVRNQFDSFNELLKDRVLTASSSLYDRSWDLSRKENTLAAYAEYTFSHEDKISVSGSLSVDVNSLYGTTVSPRMNARFTPIEWLTFRASGGEGHRSPNVVVDNIGMLSTGRMFSIASDLQMEKAWTYGGSITFDIPVGVTDNCWFSVDFFHSDFVSQVIADQECVDATKVMLYNLDGQSYTNTYQADFSIEPFDRFTVLATFRYTDSKVTLADLGLVERPLQSRWKGVLNLQYATKMSKWVFDFTAQLNGPARIPAFAARRWGYDESPVYPVLFAQVTRKFKGIEVYAGGENLTGYTQARYLNTENVIDASNPFSSSFNASSVWGPLMGITVYAGVRFTLWKQE